MLDCEIAQHQLSITEMAADHKHQKLNCNSINRKLNILNQILQNSTRQQKYGRKVIEHDILNNVL